ncbi:MAG: outer membrane lipid asymmetry maintenance protein MlaD [Gammaproteobacteria bacterium]|nr:MAG: outer membrane lipid asymmetry maintenance protein MlaD [Gammaproteobacteria bacterium]
MKGNLYVEIAVAFFILSGIIALAILSYHVSNLTTYSDSGQFEVTGKFDNIIGLEVRTPVKLGGMKIGTIRNIELDPSDHQAIVTMQIDNKYNRIPRDTNASVYTAGLLGDNYIHLEPGGEEDSLKQGDKFQLTQGGIILEKILQRAVDLKDKGDKEKKPPSQPSNTNPFNQGL